MFVLTCAMSSRQLKMYFLASLDFSPVSFSCSSVVWRRNTSINGKNLKYEGRVDKDLLSKHMISLLCLSGLNEKELEQ